MDQQEGDFTRAADRRLSGLAEALEQSLGEAVEDIELAGGILTIELADGARYLLNKHTINREIWLASPVSGAHHFRLTDGRWRSTRGGALLEDLLGAEFSARLGRPIAIGL